MPPYIQHYIRALLLLFAWLSCTAESIIVPSGKVGPITPYRTTPKPTSAPGYQARDPAPVVEYSPENPEPPPLDPAYVPTSYKTLSALSGNSIFYIPYRIKNIHSFQSNSFTYVSPTTSPSTSAPQSQSKFVTWKGTYYGTPGDKTVRVKIPVPIQEIDYTFPMKRPQPMRPIVVLPITQNDDYNKWKQPPSTEPSDAKNNQENKPHHNNHYPKKYSGEGSTSKYVYYIKHNRR
ncbi:uncharacterized protein LOC142331346 [Lycorma delicatula]|uniref:uncharacterized protein LOC142331346 n=1 Tax=Lycorma delicatula TaxID=130591 RepID=UPI003F51533B